MTRKRYCDNCGKPLGSTRGMCHNCGGESFRADRKGGDFSPINGVAHWFRKVIGK